MKLESKKLSFKTTGCVFVIEKLYGFNRIRHHFNSRKNRNFDYDGNPENSMKNYCQLYTKSVLSRMTKFAGNSSLKNGVAVRGNVTELKSVVNNPLGLDL